MEVAIEAPSGRPETGSITTLAPGVELDAVSLNESCLPIVAANLNWSGCVVGAQTTVVVAARAAGRSTSSANAATARNAGSSRATASDGVGAAFARVDDGRGRSVFMGCIRGLSIE